MKCDVCGAKYSKESYDGSGECFACFEGLVIEEMVETEWSIYKSKPVQIKAKRMLEPFEVQTLEGLMKGNAGDWLIEGTEGENYPCKDSVFRRKYEWAEKEAKKK